MPGANKDSADGATVLSGTETEQRLNLVTRILQSSSFSKSARLTEMFRYVAAKTLEGATEDLSEYQIGIHVFGRAESYSPGEDSIVRSHARLLRQRLELYFKEEGQHEKLRAVIPKGAYSLHFEAVEPIAIPAAVSAPEVAPARFLKPLVLAFVALAAAGTISFFIHRAGVSAADRFWSQVFSKQVKTFIVPADSSLVLVEDLTQNEIGLTNYLDRTYRLGHSSVLTDSILHDLAARRYTSIADLLTTTRLMNLPQAQSVQAVVRYARDLQLRDVKDGNVILLGGSRANPWVELFEAKTNFQLDHKGSTGVNIVRNRAPRGNDLAEYDDNSRQAYGLVAYLPGLSSNTDAIIIRGTSAAGTECAADFLFDANSIGAFLKSIERPSGRLPYFEVLLKTGLVDGVAQQHEVIASRVIEP